MANFTSCPIVITSSAARINELPQINMSRIKIDGVGGLGMLGMAVVTALALPEVRIFVALSLVVGVLTGLVLIRYRSAHGGPWDSDDREHPLFDGHARRAPGPDDTARPRIVRAPSTLSGLWPERHWRSWRPQPRGPVSCIN
jgi:hypothetical protein